MHKVNIDYLNECLDYNPESGFLTWKLRPKWHFRGDRIFKGWNTKYSGKTAGNLSPSGYIRIGIDTLHYKAHRLAWALYYGYFPENGLDHKDRIRHHNWILNLREATQQCNMRNAGISKNSKTGVKGVNPNKAGKKWRARIKVNFVEINLGKFDFFDDAVMARWQAEVKYKFPSCDTSSSAYIHLKEKGII